MLMEMYLQLLMKTSTRNISLTIPHINMNNEMWRLAMVELIEEYSTSRNPTYQIDYVYVKFCDVVFNEMDTYLQYSLAGKK